MNLFNKKRIETHFNHRRKKPIRINILCWLAMAMLCFTFLPINDASAETRKLKLYFLHTKEKAEITFKKNGRYVPSGLKKINRFLRDWRRNEPTKMDPKLLDLIWEVYQKVGGKKHIHVVSGYRSVKTNNILRKRSRGVAKNSQHSLGKAMDFFIPGVKLAKLRKAGLQMGLGGVGYYPRSGSPFVHLDTGRVRHWPRMSRKQLVSVFPRGKTLHVPTDGKPLPGYNVAKLEYERKIKSRNKLPTKEQILKKPSLIARGSGDDREDDRLLASATPTAVASATTQTANETTPLLAAPTPNSDPTLTAFLPNINTVPIPTTAPRDARSNGTALAFASTVSDEQNVFPDEPAPDEPAQEQLAFLPPVPIKRPSLDAGLTPPSDILPRSANQGIQVAALTPSEIQDLRRQVYSTLRSTNNTDNSAPIPQGEIPFSPPLDEVEQSPFSPPLAEIEQNPFSPPLAEIEQTPFSPPVDVVEEVAIEPIEPGVQSTGNIAIPTNNPIEKPVQEVIETAALNIPVPIKSPLSNPVIEQPSSVVEQPNQEVAQVTAQPTTPSAKKNVAGKWAMVNSASISQIAEINPPDYTLNIMRQRPDTVLSSGFSKVQLETVTNTFTGSSLEFLDFTKLN